jgi:hypothetical protein
MLYVNIEHAVRGRHRVDRVVLIATAFISSVYATGVNVRDAGPLGGRRGQPDPVGGTACLGRGSPHETARAVRRRRRRAAATARMREVSARSVVALSVGQARANRCERRSRPNAAGRASDLMPSYWSGQEEGFGLKAVSVFRTTPALVWTPTRCRTHLQRSHR